MFTRHATPELPESDADGAMGHISRKWLWQRCGRYYVDDTEAVQALLLDLGYAGGSFFGFHAVKVVRQLQLQKSLLLELTTDVEKKARLDDIRLPTVEDVKAAPAKREASHVADKHAVNGNALTSSTPNDQEASAGTRQPGPVPGPGPNRR